MEKSASLLIVSGMQFEAKLAAAADVQTLYGLNPAKLERDIIQAIHRGVQGIISFGTAGGIDPSLKPGTVVIARRVVSGEMIYTADELWIAPWVSMLPQAVFADMVGVNFPVTTIAEKATIFAETNAAAVDMESHHIARIAQRFCLPFAALRVVLDPAEMAVPPAALAATRDDGTINYAKLAFVLLKSPRQISKIMVLGKHQRAAKRSLVNSCRRLGTDRFGLNRRLSL